MSGRREIVTRKWETQAGSLVCTEYPDRLTVSLHDEDSQTGMACKLSDLIALAELLKQEKP